jgi:DNA-binding MarR family transcriptional regulator
MENIALDILLIRAAFIQCYRKEFAGKNLNYRLFIFLSYISEHPGVRMSEISIDLGVGNAKTTRSVQSLVSAGYVKAAKDANDSRSKLVSITPNGAKLVKEAHDYMNAFSQDCLSALDPEERESFEKSLAKIRSKKEETLPTGIKTH